MSSESTRARIVAAAAELFAEGGEEATSLRAITRRAHVNVAAIHYHFGGRDALLGEVLDLIVRPLNARRHQLLDEAVAVHGDHPPLSTILEAFLLPDLELLNELRRDRVHVARFLGRAYSQPSPAVSSFMEGQFAPIAERIYPLLEAALPNVTSADLRVRMQLVVAMVTNLFATAPDPAQPGPLGTSDIDQQLRTLVSFCAGGLAGATAPAREPS